VRCGHAADLLKKENSGCGEKGQSGFEFKLPDELKMLESPSGVQFF
jgi:hypothetical protein